MKSFAFVFASVCALACTSSDADLDEEAVADGADGKADSIAFVRLERATPAEVATSFTALRSEQLATCFAAYQSRIDASATQLTKPIAEQFIQVAIATNDGACDAWNDLREIVFGVLDMTGVDAASLDDVLAALPDWATPQLELASVAGYVHTSKLPLLFYDDLMRVRDENAMAREKNPTGVDLNALRAQWAEVRDDTTLDRAYLNPVTFPPGALEGSQLFKSLRAAFPLRYLSLQSTATARSMTSPARTKVPTGIRHLHRSGLH